MERGKKEKHPHTHKREGLVKKTVKDTLPANDPPTAGDIARVVDEDKDADAHQDKRTHNSRCR